MPYKDPEAKRQWEFKHRTERLGRRRELRRIRAAPSQRMNDPGGTGVLLLFILAGFAVAACSPTLAIGAGGLTLLAATYYRKGWQWLLVGALTILLAFLFLEWDGSAEMKQKKNE